MQAPIIGITVDNKDNTADSQIYEVGTRYSLAISEAGGVPILLPHATGAVGAYVALCDGIVLTGGVDPNTSQFGQPMHPKARQMDPTRQAFETELLHTWNESKPASPLLGVCLGMQLMSLYHGGALNQWMPDTMDDADAHYQDAKHAVTTADNPGPALPPSHTETITSHHRQAVAEPGTLKIAATAPDGVIEAVVDLSRPFYLGVQWHPERGGTGPLSEGLFQRLVRVAGG